MNTHGNDPPTTADAVDGGVVEPLAASPLTYGGGEDDYAKKNDAADADADADVAGTAATAAVGSVIATMTAEITSDPLDDEMSASASNNVMASMDSPTHVKTVDDDGLHIDDDGSSPRTTDAAASATTMSYFETALPSLTSKEFSASEAVPALEVSSLTTTLQPSQSSPPPTSPPFLSTKVTSGPAHWDSVKSRLLMLVSASMSSSLAPSLILSSSSSLLQLLSEMRGKDYSNLPTSERSFLLSALLPALSKILVDPNGRAATYIRSAVASGGGGDGEGDSGNKEGNKKRKRKDSKSAVAEKFSDSNNDTDLKSTTTIKQSKKKKRQQELPPPRTTPSAFMPSPMYHVPPHNADVLAVSPSQSLSSETHTTIRNAALQLLEQLTLQLLLTAPLSPSSLFESHRNDRKVRNNIEVFLFRMHAPSIMSIAIHVMMEDTESNALLANNGLLVRILRGYHNTSVVLMTMEGNSGISSGVSGSGGGKEALKTLRECQALLDFVVECYKRLGGSGHGKRKKGANNTQTTKRSDTIPETSLSPGKTPTKKLTTTSNEGQSIMISTPEKKNVSSEVMTATLQPKSLSTSNTSIKATTTTETAIIVESSQLYRLLSEMPLTIMLLFNLFPNKLASKNNMSNLLPAMMDFLHLQTISTSSLLRTNPGGGGDGVMTGALTTPSLSTPQVVIFNKGKGGSSSSSQPSLTAATAAAVGDGAPNPALLAAATTKITTTTTLAKSSTAYTSTPPSATIATIGTTTILATPKKDGQTSLLHQLESHQQLVACQVKVVSFITHLLLLLAPSSQQRISGGNSNNRYFTVATAAETTLKLFEESCATCVLQLLRRMSSSWSLLRRTGAASTATTTTAMTTGSYDGRLHNLRHQHHAIQMRKELMVNIFHMLSTKYRRGFYRHVDALLDERLLIGSTNAILLRHGVGGATSAVVMLGGGLDLGGDGEGFIGRGGDGKYNNIEWNCTIGGSGGATRAVEGVTSLASMQPLGYFILTEFITQIRTKLTPAQLSRTIRIFSRLLHCDLTTGFFDAPRIIVQSGLPNFTSPYSDMQIASAKLLMHLPEIIFHNRDPNPQVGRDLLFRILRSCVSKLEVVSCWIPDLLNAVAKLKSDIRYEDKTEQVGGDGTDSTSSSLPLTIILNLQLLLRPIIHGMKTLLWCISSYSHQREKDRQRSLLAGEEQFPLPPQFALLGSSSHDNRKFFNEELNSGMTKMTIGERSLVEDFIRVGVPCLRIFKINVRDELNEQLQPWRSPPSSIDDEKRKINPGHREILESFAVSLTSLEPYNFRVVIANNLPYLFHQMDIEEENLAMFSHLLVTAGAVSYEFVEVILDYLMANVDGLGEYEKKAISNTSSSTSMSISDSQMDDNTRRPSNTNVNSLPPPVLTKRARNLSKLFKLAFSSLIKYPRNENAFLPHLQKLVKECVQRSMEECPSQSMMGGVCRICYEKEVDLIWPGPYLDIIRILFRTISGKFDASYKELLPLVPTLLNNFYRIFTATCSIPLRQVIVEICLTIPSRLSMLLPHLPLLLKIIIPALNSNMGTLTNLALRTLEFWVDNLHPDYLYPIFATQDDDGTGFCELMAALTRHLLPAPYPYGLLCMRLLGKMGGINRLFLREMVGYVDSKRTEENRRRVASGCENLSMYCEWHGIAGDEPSSDMSFFLPFPLDRAVEVLRCVAAAPSIIPASHDNHSNCNSRRPLQVACRNIHELLSVDPKTFDLKKYSIDVMLETRANQSKSAFTVLQAALASLLDIDDEEGNGQISVCTKNGVALTKNDAIVLQSDEEGEPDLGISQQGSMNYNRDFKLVCEGLYAASNHDDLKDEAMLILKGLGSHIFYLLLNHRADITRIDRDGCSIDPYHGDESSGSMDNEKYNSQNYIAEKIQFKSFGCFRLSGPLDCSDIDPFVFNEALADAFTDSSVNKSHFTAMEVMHHVVELFHIVNGSAETTPDEDKNEPIDAEMKDAGSPTATEDALHSQDTTWGDVFFENLLSKLCHYCFSQPWNHRTGVMFGLFDLIVKMGLKWSAQYEVEILHTAMFMVKDTPDGIAHASKASAGFFLQVSWFFFGGPSSWNESSTVLHDVLCPTATDKKFRENVDKETPPTPLSVKAASLTLILSEIASTKPLVRFVVRHAVRMITRDSASIDELLVNHVNSLKRLIFPKLLRTLPLPNICAAVDACAYILDRAPKLIPIEDHNLLAFLSELLKMISIADGEFSDPSFGSVVLIDKNGFAVNIGGESASQNMSGTHASSIFLRKAMILEDDSFGGRVLVPQELPLGIQLRVSTLLLIRALIRGFADEFYDADPQSKIGNIRPHVVSLLFRSLISEPPEAVAASASALHDALILGKEKDEGSSSTKGHRLSKELIQSCIRPILLNLREHTKLSLHLLRGLSHLLVLLSSWFNKTLGEKLIEHLNRFGEPDKIMQLQVFKPGDEPLIAAAVLDLFSLLPQASQFVESLIKQTVRLEMALPRYKPCLSASPFKEPLAKYLNRHYAIAVSFFLQEHRLCNPVYSNLFQEMLKREDTALLRDYLSANSVLFLNLCFDRPLHIIRSEKSSAPEGKVAVYGINEWCSPSTQRKLEVLRQEIEVKKKFLALKSQEEARSQKAQIKSDDSNPEYRSTLQTAVERANKELEGARNAYAREVSQLSAQSNVSDETMTITSLELQHQGLKIVEILTSLNPQYLQNQNDVVRALRWLWRSRGRHYRLLHEEEIPPRYHCESLALGKFLVSYSKMNPTDTDVLFDLIRIFLQPLSTFDFSFIKQFLLCKVSSDNTDQKRILQRFSTLLSSEGSDETKTLSAQLLVIPMLKQTSSNSFFNDSSVEKLIESLLKDDSHGPMLTCELLHIVATLLEHKHLQDMTVYRHTDLLNFILAAQKNHDDPKTMYYAYVALSRFIAVFDTPSDVILQVYCSLIRDTSAREALDVLLPALSKRLSQDELVIALKFTIQVLREDNNSIPQMAHILVSVTRHPEVFRIYKSEFIPHILQSLSLLTMQSTVAFERIKLSADLAKLLFDWVIAGRTSKSTEELRGLDENTINIIVNNLIRGVFATIAGRPDQLGQRLQRQILLLLRDFVSYQRNCQINPSPFEKVLLHETDAGEERKHDSDEASNSTSIRKQSSDSTAVDSYDVKINSLRVCAEIVLILIQNDPKNSFLDQYGAMIVNQCFGNEKSSLGQNLEDVIIHWLSNGHESNDTISYIVAMLERALREGTISQKKLSLSMIGKVCDVNRDFIEPFSSSLTGLVEELAAEHVKELIDQTSNSFVMQHMAKSWHQDQLPATPTLGIFEASCSIGKDVQMINSGFNNQVVVVDNETLSMSLQLLISSMQLAASSDILSTFSRTRLSFIRSLSTILDFSCSIPVLMTAVSIIGQWITENGQKMTLTKSECESFLLQLALLDFKRLPETSSHALSDLICCIVLSMYGHNSSMIQNCSIGLDMSRLIANHYFRDRVDNDVIFQKLFVSCLLSRNPHVRSLSIGIISTQLKYCEMDDTIDTVGISNRCTSDILVSLLNLDYESIGGRLWTTVFVDVLLASCQYDTGGVRLCRQGLNDQVFATQMNGHSLLLGFMRLNHKKSSARDCNVNFRPDDIDGFYSPFLKVIKSLRSDELCGRGRCISAVRNLVHGDVDTCQSMLELCFQSVWQSLLDDQARASLIEPLERLIAKPFHSQVAKSRHGGQTNAVQSILRVLVRLRPMPFIDHFLLQSLAVTYNVRNEALSLIERRYISTKAHVPNLDSSSNELIKAAQKCYDSLGDRDVALAIYSAMAQLPGTKFALSLDMYDLVNESTKAYLSLIDRADGSGDMFLPTESEMVMWEERWVESHKELGQWSVVEEFASSTKDTTLMLECAWKTNNWEKVKCLCELPSVVASLEDGDPLTKITEIYLAIHEGNLGEVENLHWQSAQLCLHRWSLMPAVTTGGSAHNSIFQLFQRLVELRESSQIAIETSSHSARRTIPDLKLLLNSWRHRLPNFFERVSQWNDIALWRLQIFDAIARNFSWTNDPNVIATLQDRPFVCISLGRTSRKQGLKEVAAYFLDSLKEPGMDVEYEFLKLREQVVNFQFSSADSLKDGLNLVNSTNLSPFDSQQKAEIFRLKARFFYELNDKPKSNQAYCHAVQMCPTYARTWVDWGHLCASLSDDAQKQAGDEKTDSKELSKKAGLYLSQAMGCFLEAVRCNPNEQSRDHIPLCLSMLSNDGPAYGNLCRTFETRSAVLPSWVFLPWIPQLLTSLCRTEARAMKAVLVGILKDHPQAIYYSLRSFYLERRDIERSTGQTSVTQNDADTLTSSRLAEEFMSNLRKVHPVLWSKLESILEDLIVRFRPSYDAELLHSIVALLEKASKPEFKTSKDNTISGTETFGHLDGCTKTLHLLGAKFFNINKEKPDSAITRKAVLFRLKYCDEFKKDFLIEEEGLKSDDLVAKLHKWKKMLDRGISRVPKTSSLQGVSPSLSWYSSQPPDLWAGACESKSLNISNSSHDAYSSLDNALFHAKRSSALVAAKASAQAVLVAANSEGIGGHSGAAVVEIPGQYAPTSSNILDSRPIPELHAKLVRFHQTLELSSSSTKHHVHQITMIGSDGNMYKFLLQLAIPYWIRTDERSAQMNYAIRKILRRDYRACRRSLTTRPSVVIPVAQRMRMSANRSSYESLESIFCHVQGPRTSMLPAYFQEKVAEIAALRNHALGECGRQNETQVLNQAKLEVYHDMCRELVLPNVLSKYMDGKFSALEQLYRFRHVFSSQLAANSLLQHALAIIERTPNRFAFCTVTGQMISQDFRSQYNHGLLEKHGVPFRLTRNISEFIGPFLIEGVFVPSLVIISSALHANRKVLKPILHLLLRDDVMAWYVSKSSSKNDQKMQEVERQLSDRIWSNVLFVQGRFEECSMRAVDDATAEAIKPNPDPIDIKVRSLINAATNTEKLSQMPPAYQPWL